MLTSAHVLQGNVAGKTKGFDDIAINEGFAESRTASQPISLTSTICIMPAVERMLVVLTPRIAVATVAMSSNCYL